MLSNRFRWVYCKLDVLRQCHRHDLRRILKESPRSLDETYERILKEINNANPKQAHRLLQCLVATHRPLRMEELAVVLALDVDAGGMPRLNAKWLWEDHEAAVLSVCSSLVSVVNHEGSRIIQFCHVSAKEFLISDRLFSSMEDISHFHIAHEPSHAILAQACLGTLLSVGDSTSEDRAGEFPLSAYAYKYWFKHAQAGYVELQIRDVLDRLFDLDKPHFTAFFHSSRACEPFRLRFSSESGEKSKGVLSPAAPFYFAAISGLSGLAERLIMAKKPQILSFCGHKGTLLHLAVREGQIETARLLLSHGADINSRKDCVIPPGITLLQGYSQGLENMGRGERHCTPLHLAASEGHLDICQILLERGADACVHNDSGDTPLHLAASSNLLLAHNADAFVHDKRGNTPLHFTSSDGHLEVTRMLLERGADVSSQNNEGLNPLQQASQGLREGCLDIMRLLLDHGANLTAHDNSGNTALHFAVSKGHLEAARMLLERGANVDSQNHKGLTPLQRASQVMWERHLYISLLLNLGANVDARDNHGNTALHFAASGGRCKTAHILLERGANINSQNNEGLTPLQQASQSMREGYLDVMGFLLDHGANWDSRDNHGNTALHLVASKGRLEAAHILLGRGGADAHARNLSGKTASEVARGARRDKFVQLLSQYTAK